MHKRVPPVALLASWLVFGGAAPLAAAEESSLQVSKRIGRGAQLPHAPGDAAPIATPIGDDDMPNRDVRPRAPSAPVTQAVTPERGDRNGWLRSLWAQWLELRGLGMLRD